MAFFGTQHLNPKKLYVVERSVSFLFGAVGFDLISGIGDGKHTYGYGITDCGVLGRGR